LTLARQVLANATEDQEGREPRKDGDGCEDFVEGHGPGQGRLSELMEQRTEAGNNQERSE
jgi:hypothetical protein